MGDPPGQSRVRRHDLVPQAEHAGLIVDHFPGGQQAAMAMDRQFRFRQVLRQETDGPGGPGAGSGVPRSAAASSLHQIDGAELAMLEADDGGGPGTINLNAAYFLDRENAKQEAAAQIGAGRTEDFLVLQLERLRHPRRLRPRRGGSFQRSVSLR